MLRRRPEGVKTDAKGEGTGGGEHPESQGRFQKKSVGEFNLNSNFRTHGPLFCLNIGDPW